MVAAGTKQKQSRIGQLRRLLLPLLYQIISHYQMMKIGALASSTVGLWWQLHGEIEHPSFIYLPHPTALPGSGRSGSILRCAVGGYDGAATFAACSCITSTTFTTVPVGRLALSTGSGRFFPRYLNETVVQREIVPDGVLPALAIFAIEKGGFSGRWTDFRNENGSDQLFSPKYDWPSVAALCSEWGR
uniref:Uncharacterized protein n=1 Tax=Anopheles melas TaxID=34690 RepID=A0A182UAC7_9DIPT